jgi:uncharacterized protein YPO0396
MEMKKDILEYLNLSLMNIAKALDKLTNEQALTNERLTTLNDRLEKINWNLGLIAKPKK